MNKEQLTEAIVAIAPDTEVADKSNAELEALLASLQPASPPPPAPQDAAADAAAAKIKAQATKAAAGAVKSKSRHVIAPGQSVTSKRGILAEGEDVSVDDFVGGKVDFERLAGDGCIVRN